MTYPDSSNSDSGEPVDLWELYNMMTQLGGFETVTANTWWFVFTKDQPTWAAMRGSVLRLKGIYRQYLLPYEKEFFGGKRFVTNVCTCVCVHWCIGACHRICALCMWR